MDARTAALHAAEFLRWHLRSHASGHTERSSGAPVAPAEPAEPAARTPAPADLRISLLPVVTFSPGGTEAGFGGQVDLLRRWGSFGARLLGATSLVNNHMSVPEGSIDVRMGWGGIEGVAILGSATSGISADLGLGVGLFSAALRGTANPDNISQDDHLLTVAPIFDLRARQRLAAGFALTLGGSCLVPLRSSRMRVLEIPVGRFGQAVVTLGLGVEFTLL